MKRILSYITAMACLAAIAVSAQTRTVTVNTNGVLVYPTNFFSTNLVGTVSGSGTATYIPKWTSTTALGNSAMYEEGATNEVVSIDSPWQFTVRNSSGGTHRKAGVNYRIDSSNLWQTYVDNTDGNSWKIRYNNSTDLWRVTTGGVLESVGSQILRTSTGDLTVGTGGGNGNILLQPNGSGYVIAGNTATVYVSGFTEGIVSGTGSASTRGGLSLVGHHASAGSAFVDLEFHNAAASPTRTALVQAYTGAAANDGRLYFWTSSSGSLAHHWTLREDGVWESNGAKTIRTSTGNLTLATAGGNGSVLVTPNGTGTLLVGSAVRAGFDINNSNDDNSLDRVLVGRFTQLPTNTLSTFIGYGDSSWTGAGADGALVMGARSSSTLPIQFYTGSTTPSLRWSVKSSGELEGNGASYVQTSTGNLTLRSLAGNGHVLLSPNGTGGIGVNTTPTSTLHVNGSEASTYATKTTNYTLTATDQTILASASGGSVTMTLPTSVGIGGRRYSIKRTDASANTLTVATTSSQTIDGSTSVTIPAYGILQVISDNANWAILNSGNVAGASATPTTAPNPLTRRVNHMIPQGGGTVTINGLGDTMSQSAGTQSAVSPDSNVGTMVKWATAATSGARAYGGGNSNYRAGRNLLFAALVRVADTNAVRIWVAFTDGSITGLCDNDDPASYHLAGFRWSTAAGDAAWMACTKDGSTLGTTSTGITPSTTAPMRLEVEEDTANAKYYFRINGTLVATRTANLPGTTVNMYYGMTAEPTENVSKSIEFGQATIVSDK